MNTNFFGDSYQVYEQIGKGGLGTVFRARHMRLQKDVVIKRVDIVAMNAADNRREADILKNLRHSYLPQVLDLIEQDGVYYTVMDYIEGKSFQQLLDGGRVFSQQQAVKYGSQLLEAIDYLHTQRISVLHGDIKPANVMLTPEDNICLIDFNVSGLILGQKMITVGFTGGYAAPEQIRAIREARARKQRTQGAGSFVRPAHLGADDTTELLGDTTELLDDTTELLTGTTERAADDSMLIDNSASVIDARADLYSVGAFLYRLVVGKKPAADPRQVTPVAAYENFSDAFAAVVDRAMREAPGERFDSAAQMLAALRGYARADRRYRRLKFRQGILFTVLLLGLAACVFVATLGFGRMRTEKSDALLSELMAAHQGGDAARFEELYEETVENGTWRMEAHREKALYLFESGEYGTVTDFVSRVLEDEAGNTEADPAVLGDLYHIRGNSYFDTGNLRSAEDDFRTALTFRTDDLSYYRDLAIALAENGNTGEAAQVLEHATGSGLSEDQIAIVRAEIASANGEYAQALTDFQYCIDHTQDGYIRYRAYLFGARAYDRKGSDAGTLAEKAAFLERARAALPPDRLSRILNMLSQTYISLYLDTGSSAYAEQAVEILRMTEQNGTADIDTYNYLVIIFMREERAEDAQNAAKTMLERYPDRYETYKRLARLEVWLQGMLPEDARDYQRFQEYCLKAQELYQPVLRSGQTDEEMRVLEEEYENVLQGNWLQ